MMIRSSIKKCFRRIDDAFDQTRSSLRAANQMKAEKAHLRNEFPLIFLPILLFPMLCSSTSTSEPICD